MWSREHRLDPVGELAHASELIVDELAQDEVGGSGRDALVDSLDAVLDGSGDDRASSEELHQAEFIDEAGVRFRSLGCGVRRRVVPPLQLGDALAASPGSALPSVWKR